MADESNTYALSFIGPELVQLTFLKRLQEVGIKFEFGTDGLIFDTDDKALAALVLAYSVVFPRPAGECRIVVRLPNYTTISVEKLEEMEKLIAKLSKVDKRQEAEVNNHLRREFTDRFRE